MILRLKTRESRSLPGLLNARRTSLLIKTAAPCVACLLQNTFSKLRSVILRAVALRRPLICSERTAGAGRPDASEILPSSPFLSAVRLTFENRRAGTIFDVPSSRITIADLRQFAKNSLAVQSRVICPQKTVSAPPRPSCGCAKTALFRLARPFSEGTVNHRFLCLRGHSIGESPVWHPCVFLGQI